MTSLSRKLTISLTFSLFCFFFVQVVLVGMEIRKLTEDGVISRLEDDMEGILAALAVKAEKKTDLEWEHIPEIFKRPFSGHYFQIWQGEQSIRSRSLWDRDLPLHQVGVYREVPGPENQQLILLYHEYVVHGRKVLLSVGADISELKATTLYIQKQLITFSLTALLVLLLIQIWVIRRSLQPLSGVRQELQQLELGETDMLRQDVPAEIRPLVEEVNHLLIVLQQRLQRSRNAMGNLSHALKTPLTIMFQILERKKEDRDCIQLLQQAHHIENHINRELSRARTAGQTPGGLWAEPEQDLQDLVATLQTVYGQNIGIELKSSGLRKFAADREDMMELVGNLIDNACKWAKGRVRMAVYEQGGLHITIEDDGPGMSREEQLLALERGVRLDEAKQGHGLGLSIVREIVDAYHGSFELGRSSTLGGLKVSLYFPHPQGAGI